MANDVVSVGNAATGIQPRGDIIVKTGGKGIYGRLVDRNSRMETSINIANIAAKYTDNFDDPHNKVSVSDTPHINKGYQQIATLTSATSLTVPDGSRFAFVQAEDGGVRWLKDGTSPTSTSGILIADGDNTWIAGQLSALQFIEVDSGAKIHVDYEGF